MKVGFDAKRFFFNYTGLGNYSRSLVKSLTDFYPDDEYLLFTPRPGKMYSKSDLPPQCKVIEPKGLTGNLLPGLWRRYLMSKDIIGNNPDIYHGLSHEVPPGLTSSKVRTVVTVHDLIFLRYPEFYKPWDVLSYKKRYLKSCHLADRIIAISENTRRDIVELLNINEGKISVVYQSVNPVFYREISGEFMKEVSLKHNLPDNYILSVGSLNKRKNTGNLIEALNRIKNKELNLVIVGKGSEYGNLVRQIRELNLENRVYFYSSISNEELPVFYHKSKVFVYPSIYEGLGLPIIESLLCQTPVITNKGSCFYEAGGNGALYVDVSSPDEIAAGIDTFNDEKTRLEFSMNGNKTAKKFSSEAFARGNHQVYESLLT